MRFLSKDNGNSARAAVGPELAAVLPKDAKPWYRTWHLVKLNLVLLAPLLSAGSVGYDGLYPETV
jgi:hypothetical protein